MATEANEWSPVRNNSNCTDMKVTDDNMEQLKVKQEKRKIIKNVLLVSLAFLMNFNAYQGLSRLQSSLHDEEGIGVITQSVLYASFLLSSFLLPNLVISHCGHKWTIAICICGYITWMIANGYVSWGTMIPTSIIVGLVAAPLWTAKCAYLTLMAVWYSKLSGEAKEVVISRFFGIFFMFFQLASVTGSIISSTILNTGHNGTITYDTSVHCGVEYCPWSNVTHIPLNNPAATTIWTLLGVYIGISCLAVVIVCVFMDQVPAQLLSNKVDIRRDLSTLLLSTIKQLKYKSQLLIIPITIYGGFEQAFYNVEFAQSFVTCSVGLWKVGLVTLPFGVVNMTMSFGVGYVVKYTGRIMVITAGVIVDLCIHFTLLYKVPTPNTEYVLFILAAMWGFTDAVWQTQINALYGSTFKNTTAAFASYKVWECLGFILAFVWSYFLCTGTKTYILLGLLVSGAIGYFLVEYNLYKQKRRLAV